MIATTQWVYAGGYAKLDQPGIHAFAFDTGTGTLTLRGALAGITNPSYLVVHPNQRWLYAVSETQKQAGSTGGAVCAVRSRGELWELELVNQQPSGGDWPCHLTIDASGRWILVANYGSGNVGVLPIDEDGALGEMTDQVQHAGSGPNQQRQEGPHAHSTLFTPDQRFVIVADLGIDTLAIYEFDAHNGRLREHERVATRPAAGPRHMAFHPDNRRLYVANELDNTVTAYDYDALAGTLRERQTLPTLPPDAPENTVADIHLTSSADWLYVSNRGHNSIASFRVSAEGTLEQAGHSPCGGSWPRNFAIAPGDRFMLVANQHSNAVTVHAISAESGELQPPLAQATVAGASCVRFLSPAV